MPTRFVISFRNVKGFHRILKNQATTNFAQDFEPSIELHLNTGVLEMEFIFQEDSIKYVKVPLPEASYEGKKVAQEFKKDSGQVQFAITLCF